MWQKENLDLLCFVFSNGKECSVHLFVKIYLMTNLIKVRSIQPMGALPPPPLTPCLFLRTLHLPASYTHEYLFVIIKMSNADITNFLKFNFLFLLVYQFHYVY